MPTQAHSPNFFTPCGSIHARPAPNKTPFPNFSIDVIALKLRTIPVKRTRDDPKTRRESIQEKPRTLFSFSRVLRRAACCSCGTNRSSKAPQVSALCPEEQARIIFTRSSKWAHHSANTGPSCDQKKVVHERRQLTGLACELSAHITSFFSRGDEALRDVVRQSFRTSAARSPKTRIPIDS